MELFSNGWESAGVGGEAWTSIRPGLLPRISGVLTGFMATNYGLFRRSQHQLPCKDVSKVKVWGTLLFLKRSGMLCAAAPS